MKFTSMKRIPAFILVLIMTMSLCVCAFADDAAEAAESKDSEFALFNQYAHIYASPDDEAPAAGLGRNTFVKVVEVKDGKALIQWEGTCRFIDNKVDGEGWVDASALDMISEADLPNFMKPYPDIALWFGLTPEQASAAGAGGRWVDGIPSGNQIASLALEGGDGYILFFDSGKYSIQTNHGTYEWTGTERPEYSPENYKIDYED